MDVNVWNEYFHFNRVNLVKYYPYRSFKKFHIKLNYIFSDHQCLHSTCLILRNKDSAQSVL